MPVPLAKGCAASGPVGPRMPVGLRLTMLLSCAGVAVRGDANHGCVAMLAPMDGCVKGGRGVKLMGACCAYMAIVFVDGLPAFPIA